MHFGQVTEYHICLQRCFNFDFWFNFYWCCLAPIETFESLLTQPNNCICKRRHNNGVILKLQQVLLGLTGYSLATVQEASWGHCVYGKSSQLSTEVMMRSYNTRVQRREEEPLRPSCSGAEPSVNCNNSSARWVRLLRGKRGLSSRCRLPCTRKKISAPVERMEENNKKPNFLHWETNK